MTSSGSRYQVELTGHAERILRRLAQRERPLYDRICHVFVELGRDPFQGKLLTGELHGRYSYRIGSYRVIYVIQRHRLIVSVIDIGHRRDVYR